MKLKKKQRIMMLFYIGYIMFAAGLLLFTKFGIADIGLYAFSIGNVHLGKIVIIIPILIGVYRMFQNYESMDARIIVAIGALLIILPAIQSIKYRFQPIGVGPYLLILLLMFGGMGIVLRAIYLRAKDRHLFGDE